MYNRGPLQPLKGRKTFPKISNLHLEESRPIIIGAYY